MKNNNKYINELNEESSLNIHNFRRYDNFIKFVKKKSNNKLILILCALTFLSFCLICYIIYLLINIRNFKKDFINIPFNSGKNLNNNDKNIEIIKPYIKAQKDFCKYPNKYKNKKYENEIGLFDVKLNKTIYQIYLFKSSNFLTNSLIKFGNFENSVGNNMLKALKFYGIKNNILNNKDIFMLDIGGNVGWYPSLLGRYGYSILSFEAFERNYYVEKKNLCRLYNNSNIIIITKGLGDKEKICQYFKHINNEGNGMVICNDDKYILNDSRLKKMFVKESEVEITTLNSFIPYLSNKNIALIKLDVEGQELKILEGGSKLITQYHVPFVVLEFSPSYLKEVGSEPIKLIQFFIDNGYKISIDGFLNNKYLNADELLNKTGFQINCYFIHQSIAKKINK